MTFRRKSSTCRRVAAEWRRGPGGADRRRRELEQRPNRRAYQASVEILSGGASRMIGPRGGPGAGGVGQIEPEPEPEAEIA